MSSLLFSSSYLQAFRNIPDFKFKFYEGYTNLISANTYVEKEWNSQKISQIRQIVGQSAQITRIPPPLLNVILFEGIFWREGIVKQNYQRDQTSRVLTAKTILGMLSRCFCVVQLPRAPSVAKGVKRKVGMGNGDKEATFRPLATKTTRRPNQIGPTPHLCLPLRFQSRRVAFGQRSSWNFSLVQPPRYRVLKFETLHCHLTFYKLLRGRTKIGHAPWWTISLYTNNGLSLLFAHFRFNAPHLLPPTALLLSALENKLQINLLSECRAY